MTLKAIISSEQSADLHSFFARIVRTLGLFKEQPKVVRVKQIRDILSLEQLTDEHINVLKWEYVQLVQLIDTRNKALNEYYKEEAHKKNTVCPSCGESSARGRFKRLKGEIKGNSYSEWGAVGLLGSGIGGGSGRGSIRGSMDTEQVNECKSCGHEWEIVTPTRNVIDIESICDRIRWATTAIRDAKEFQWDPTDLSSPYSSLAEARRAELDKVLNGYSVKNAREFFGELSQELIVWVMQKNLCTPHSLNYGTYSAWEKNEASILNYITTKRVLA